MLVYEARPASGQESRTFRPPAPKWPAPPEGRTVTAATCVQDKISRAALLVSEMEKYRRRAQPEPRLGMFGRRFPFCRLAVAVAATR
jgi:hypothetical protein